MWKQKLGISISSEYPIPTTEIVKLAASVGFDAISPEWSADDDGDLKAIIDTAAQTGLAVQSLHAPIGGSANLWSSDKALSEPALDELLRSLEDCHAYGIPVLVVHTWIGFENIPEPTAKGLENYGVLVDRAAKLGVKIAFENTEGEDHLFALLDHFRGVDTVGLCWDSGHEMCYNHSEDLLARYGDRLLVTHLNDNLGISRFDGKTYWTDDLHLLPFDGVADWSYNAERLKRSKPLEYLNFELSIRPKPNRHENDMYEKLTCEEYFTQAYMRACRVAYKLCER